MRQRSLALALAAALLMPLASSAQAAPPGEADAHFKRGVELYKEADYAAALIEFRRAYELDPRFQVLYNIGEDYYQLQDYANALKTLEKYLKEGGAQISKERRDEVQKEVDKLRTRVATLDITTTVPDVELFIDDVSVGKTPLPGPIVVSAGRRKLTATMAGKPVVSQVVELAGGDSKKLPLTITDDAKPGTSPEEQRSVPVAPWVVTGVLAAGAVVTGALALVASSDLKTQLGMLPANPDDIKSAHGKAFALALTTDILVGTAAVMTGVSIYFTASAGKKPDAPAAAPKVAWSGLRASPPAQALTLQAGPRSLLLSGSF
jgi:hypothetical protein